MAAIQALSAASPEVRIAQRTFRGKPRVSTQTGGELASLYVSIAAVGIAALSSAAASSLIAGLNGVGGAAAWGQWVAVIAASSWAVAGLLYAFVSFRTANLPTILTVRAVVAAASAHLAILIVGMWRLPEDLRSLDLTLASLLVLEMSVIAVLGWQHNSGLRVRVPGARHKPSALAVVGTLFAASILVASVTTVGMAASTAGELAVPHSGHGATTPGSPLPGNLEQLKHSGHHH
ncbi:hypothetical protein CVV68_15705 [Arthrobacter livingstonensis]|uniref:Uncharacterized protein n=1 Tax=Arthrobacter livingstonensis TaxID=670078 RepID=A0A2V5LSL6_9MICC|nr:hypothetical protein [Arthrobacter livingstonensis]PYI66037.1 hypothetical protein CVV68_15705 [Arthrobacter livingstonensis]